MSQRSVMRIIAIEEHAEALYGLEQPVTGSSDHTAQLQEQS